MTAITPAPIRARTASGGGTGIAVTLCRDPEQFARLAPEWDALFERCPTATPFQTHAWLHSWWLSYGTPGRLRLVLVRRGGVLVGAAPLMLAHRPFPVLVPLGGHISDFFDVLVDAGHVAEVTTALVRGLHRAMRGAVLDLREVRPGAAAERLFAQWEGPRRHRRDSVCLDLPGVPIEELFRRMPATSAKRRRAKLRKLDALGVEHRDVPVEKVPTAVATMIRLHGLQWEGRGVTPEHVRPRFAEHLTRAVSRMARTGHARICEYLVGGEVMASDMTLLSADLAGGYLDGVHPELRAKTDITSMLLRESARHTAATGRSTFSMLRGAEPYKLRWRPVEVGNQRLLMARRELRPVLAAYAGLRTARAAAVREARERVPALLEWRSRLDEARSGGVRAVLRGVRAGERN
ncbi:GNAT family N-acetyltransferase [Streptomyces sp. DSM 42041]|uniref:GNAT family N-acetyltransferase n=1 Tax=Streptomyces hazeniae TaxID=3075538 RepID=A0ABU2NTV8_9ACTN|nr:GNAT family N-acetyltransferase [Streptomyces sp. DSM 42041]MDT0380426.1 GNAT family N-acetyltransferase [Streptomyces sp. DSM 42041]